MDKETVHEDTCHLWTNAGQDQNEADKICILAKGDGYRFNEAQCQCECATWLDSNKDQAAADAVCESTVGASYIFDASLCSCRCE